MLTEPQFILLTFIWASFTFSLYNYAQLNYTPIGTRFKEYLYPLLFAMTILLALFTISVIRLLSFDPRAGYIFT